MQTLKIKILPAQNVGKIRICKEGVSCPFSCNFNMFSMDQKHATHTKFFFCSSAGFGPLRQGPKNGRRTKTKFVYFARVLPMENCLKMDSVLPPYKSNSCKHLSRNNFDFENLHVLMSVVSQIRRFFDSQISKRC